MYQKWKYYREEKQDLERFLIFLNIKMSAKSNKIELSEEFMVMWREEQTLWDVPLCIETKMKKTSFRSSNRRYSVRKGVLRNFARSATLLKKRLSHKYFPVNFANFLRTPLLQNSSGQLFPKFEKNIG